MTIKEACLAYPHLISQNADGSLNLFVDHHVLSQLRLCEAKFVEEILCHHGPKAQRYFSLEFGTWIHECLEDFYNHFKNNQSAPDLNEWSNNCIKKYRDYDIDHFAPPMTKLTKEYKGDEKKWYALGGEDGARRLLFEYYAWYMDLRLKVIGTETLFEKQAPVPLGEIAIPDPLYPTDGIFIKCYLTGVMDLVLDNGYKIFVADHKSTARFDGYESDDFDPHEGICGYIYTLDYYLKNHLTDLSTLHGCNDGIIFHISIANTIPRFKPSYIHKTNEQLKEFAERQLRTCKRMVELILGEKPDWNALICNNIYNNPCPFRELHRQPTEQREATLKQFYEIKPMWDPKNRRKVNRDKNTTTATEIVKAG